jgi:hypothetical protein
MNSQVSGHKKRESWRGSVMDSLGYFLSFPTPTDTHVFGNHSNGYHNLSTATCGVQRIAENSC